MDDYYPYGAEFKSYKYIPKYYQKTLHFKHLVPWLDQRPQNLYLQDPLHSRAIPSLYHKPLTKKNDGLLEGFSDKKITNEFIFFGNILVIIMLLVLIIYLVSL